MKFRARQEVVYFSRPAWVVEARLPNRYESEAQYHLCREKDSSKIDFRNVREKHLRHPEPVAESENVLEFCKK